MKISTMFSKDNSISLVFNAENIPDGITLGETYCHYMDTVYDPFDRSIIMTLNRNSNSLLVSIKIKKEDENAS